MQKTSLIPCTKLCLNSEYRKNHKVLDMQAQIPLDDRQYYNYCKWCEIFYYCKKPKLNCKCCGRPSCRVWRVKRNGNLYES